MEENKMEEPNKPQKGTWANMQVQSKERKPQVKWDGVNESHTLTFRENDPFEYTANDNTFYIFNVIENGEEKVILTSAWSLLKGLKNVSPLKDKNLMITKKLVKGKQVYEVLDIDAEVHTENVA